MTTVQLLRGVPLRRRPAEDVGRSVPSDSTAVSIDHLHKGFYRQAEYVEVIADLTMALPRGESGALIGPSGCGKSTLLRIIAGLEQFEQGNCSVHGRPVTRARRDVGFMFQGLALLPWKSVLQNVRLPGELLGTPKEQIAQRAERCLSLVGLTGYEKYPLRQISGGMRQRVALARLLMTDTKLLLLDEPFSSLDEFTRETIDLLFMDVAAKAETDYLMVTHSIPEAVLMSDKVFVLSPPPARLLATIDVPLPRPRTKEIQDNAVFHEVTREIREVLLTHMS
jgi:NitT/TauT family transport system ATP-binding protein